MRVSLLHFPLLTLGPGVRAGLWLQGCSIRCPGCMSKHTWSRSGGYEVSVAELSQELLSFPTSRLTVSGGEPLEQYEELLELLKSIREKFCDILLYTGYQWEVVQKKFGDILYMVDVVVAGPFVKGLYTKDRLKGSENQKVVVLNEKLYNLYREYSSLEKRALQKLRKGNKIYFLGIPENHV
ncbi:MAG: 4Fe-4S single cluster domain-containing protein [Aquificaceae bacterium]|nr:4Fe-4S single cluster domain-containing protein [Aquificaceae bacterium]